MRTWTELLQTLGDVRTFDYSYMIEKQRRPDRLPKLIVTHRAALAAARAGHDGPVILIGKSMGGRIGCHVSLEEKIAALICFGYPLCGGGDPQRMRDKVLREITAPILFLQGTRDSLCPLELLAAVRRGMPSPNELFVVEGGDHSLAVGKRQLQIEGRTQNDIERDLLAIIGAFLQRCGLIA